MSTEREVFCSVCGQQVPQDSVHCIYCGAEIADAGERFDGTAGRKEFAGRSGFRTGGRTSEGAGARSNMREPQDAAGNWNRNRPNAGEGADHRNSFRGPVQKRDRIMDLDPGRGTPGYRGGTAVEKTPVYRKWWFWVIIAVVVLGLFGSTTHSDKTDTDSESTAQVEQTQSEPAEKQEEEILNPLKQCEVHEADILSGGGEVIGKRAYIEYSEEDFNKLTDAQISQFAAEEVFGRKDNYFTIVFCNGRGIVFPECKIKKGVLGTIDDAGSIVTAEKNMSVSILGKVKWSDAGSTGTEASSGTSDTGGSSGNSDSGGVSEAIDTLTAPAESLAALKKAEYYLSVLPLSKQRLYDQLTSEYGERFSEEAAQYAIDNIQADWKANALASAKNYQETMSMSNAMIYEQLVSEYGEQFTPEEAQYAIDNLG